MWQHKRYASLFIGSYDRDKNQKRYFELFGLVAGKKKRLKFKDVHEARTKGWKKVG